MRACWIGLGLAFVIWSAASERAEAQRSHRVRPGQSWAAIARRHHIRVWDLALANDSRPSRPLRAGRTITVPPRGVVYVRPGQTLSEIARDRDVGVARLRALNRLRGDRIRPGQRLILPGYEAPGPTRRDWGPSPHRGQMLVRRRGEVFTLRVLDEQGRVRRESLSQLGELMRRHEDDAVETPHPRLARLLVAISDHFGGREIVLVSGRREAGGFTRESSRHTEGAAADIRVRGVPRRALWEFCRSLASTGCGHYPRSTFVHVDVRDRAAQWVDWSRPGRRPRYGNLRGPWRRRRGRTVRVNPVGREVTRPDLVPLEVELAPATEPARERTDS